MSDEKYRVACRDNFALFGLAGAGADARCWLAVRNKCVGGEPLLHGSAARARDAVAACGGRGLDARRVLLELHGMVAAAERARLSLAVGRLVRFRQPGPP